MFEEYDGHVPGAALLVIRDGRVVLRHCAGMADLENAIPVPPSTNFRLASMTKQLIARAIEILGVPLDRAVFRNITVRQLLSHTSGLIDYEELIGLRQLAAALDCGSSLPQLTDHDVLHLLESTDRTYFPPGSQYRYSNGGYVLLGLLIERESGIPLE